MFTYFSQWLEELDFIVLYPMFCSEIKKRPCPFNHLDTLRGLPCDSCKCGPRLAASAPPEGLLEMQQLQQLLWGCCPAVWLKQPVKRFWSTEMLESHCLLLWEISPPWLVEIRRSVLSVLSTRGARSSRAHVTNLR